MKYVQCFVLVFSWLFFSSPSNFSIPERKIGRTIEEVLQVTDFELIEQERSAINCVGEQFSKQLQVFSAKELVANVYIRRVHTCDPIACEDNSTAIASTNFQDLEYFDYFVIIDQNEVLRNITVYNYQATHGQEVAKRNWLAQFINQPKSKEFTYGKTIDAISGATVSAENFTNEMSYIIDCLGRQTKE